MIPLFICTQGGCEVFGAIGLTVVAIPIATSIGAFLIARAFGASPSATSRAGALGCALGAGLVLLLSSVIAKFWASVYGVG